MYIILWSIFEVGHKSLFKQFENARGVLICGIHLFDHSVLPLLSDIMVLW